MAAQKIPQSIPKKYQDRIEHWDDERGNGDSLIVTLKAGWYWKGIDERIPSHVAGFDVVRDALDELRLTAPCDCVVCVKGAVK